MADLKSEKVIKAIEDTRGNVSAAAKSLRVSRTTLYKYINERATVKAALDEARETMLDNAESALYRAVLNGESWAVCFYLKTQGKSRGYVERAELTGAGGGPVRINVTLADDGQ
jgi:hypothetical protein